MKRNRWQEITELYHAAVELPENERAAFLETCTDGDIRREVQSLLANEKDAHSIFGASAVDAAARAGIKPRDSLAGKELGSYKLTSELGRGGMGEVYRAKDQKLGRDVAIKVLPEEFAADADRVARFQREARLLASLNHPNIGAIHGLEASGGIHFLVLELVEGETLADRLKRGPIPVEEALQLALQIAEALEAAHEKRVIHRDLKPANISVNPDGKVKVLDFGLAKALAEEQQTSLSDSPTVNSADTLHGVILGTAAYMSPEQARGKAVDKRTDIWAFGCVLYEMLSGKPAFSGEDVSDLLSAVMRAEPDWSSLPGTLHWRLRELIQRCLAKDPRNRYHDISDVRLDIQKVLADPNELSVPLVTAAGRRMSLLWAIAAMVLTGAVAGVVVWNLRQMPSPDPGPVVRFDYELPEAQRADINISHPSFILAVSPDGTQFVYCTGRGLFLRSLDEADARLIPGTGENPVSPFFSPDGKWIGYFSPTEGQLKKVAVTGGTPVVLSHPVTQVLGAEWRLDNTIIYADGDHGIMRVSADGGTPESIVEGHLAAPQLLPDGKSVLFTDISATPTYKIMVESLESRKRKELLKAEWARYLPTGHLVYGHFYWLPEPKTYAVPFNPETLEETGGRILLPELATAVLPAISDSGTVVFFPSIPGPFPTKGVMVWVDRNGKEQQIPVSPNYHGTSRVSPDATKIAVTIGSENTDIYVYDFTRQTLRRLTYDKSIDSAPAWTPDGKRIVFRSNRNGEGIYWKRADGNGEVEKLLSVPDRVLFPSSFSPDGKILAFTAVSQSTDEDIGILSLNGRREWKLLLQEKHGENNPQISPDGRFVAYSSNETGRWEVYIRSFPDMKNQISVTTDGAGNQLWCGTGKELFYRKGDAFLAVPVETDPELKLGTARVLFSRKYPSNPWHNSPDGTRFLLAKKLPRTDKPAVQDLLRRINIILNWPEELPSPSEIR